MKDSDYIKGIEGAERRYAVADMTVEKRAEGDAEAFVVEGYAALFNSPTGIYSWMEEEIMPGAFDEVLQDDVRCLFNHDPNQLLGRTAAKTLEIWVDEKGLKYRYTSPDRQYAKDLADCIRTGDVSQSSFAFTIKTANWIEREGLPDLRQITKIAKLYDVSPVTYPAYADTTVAQRSHDAFVAEKREADKNKGLSLTEAQLIINSNYI